MGKQLPDTSENIDTETKPRPRNRKGFREPTSLHIDPILWQEVKVMAVLKGVSLAEYFEDALRKKIDADNKEVGKQGYQVGHGGMYIPPPPQPKFEDVLQLPEFKFPASKNEIIKSIRLRRDSEVLIEALNKIPDKIYKNVDELGLYLTRTSLIKTRGEYEAMETEKLTKSVGSKEQKQKSK